VYDDWDGAWEVSNPTAECRLAMTASTEDPLVTGIEEAINGVICPVLEGAGPVGAPGVAEVQDDGDIAVAGEELWTCPPYDTATAGPAVGPYRVDVALPTTFP
jgi:hypothetical protein